VGAVGCQYDTVAMGAGSTCEVPERRLSKDERNILKDVEWGLHG